MIKIYNHKNLTWIDIESPTQEDVSSIVKKYNLHSTVGDELLSPTREPRVNSYESYLFLALQIPIRSGTKNPHGNITEEEVDFVLGKDFIITAHANTIESLHSLGKSFETNAILDKKRRSDEGDEHAGLIFYYIMKKIYVQMEIDLKNIKGALSNVEKNIFLGHESKMVITLSQISRDLIDFKRTAKLHREVLESFESVPKDFSTVNFKKIIADIKIEYEGIHDLIQTNRELLTDLRETNDSLLSTKQNESMRILSIMAFITFPLSLFLALFALPTTHTPIIGTSYDWEIMALIVVLAISVMVYAFKKKEWL